PGTSPGMTSIGGTGPGMTSVGDAFPIASFSPLWRGPPSGKGTEGHGALHALDHRALGSAANAGVGFVRRDKGRSCNDELDEPPPLRGSRASCRERTGAGTDGSEDRLRAGAGARF